MTRAELKELLRPIAVRMVAEMGGRTFAEPGEPAHQPELHPDTHPEHFFPEETHDLSRLVRRSPSGEVRGRAGADEYTRMVRTADQNRGGWNPGHRTRDGAVQEAPELPDRAEVKAVAGIGEAARGGYDETTRVLHHLLKDPQDVHRWVMANAILSAQEGWQSHTTGAFEALAAWNAAGRPTDQAGLDAVFGTTRRKGTATDPNGGAHLLDTPGTFVGPQQYTGSKAVQLKSMFGRGTAPGVVWNWVSEGSYKTPNFAHAFVDSRGVPIDTHMAKLVDPGFTRARMEQIVGAGNQEELSQLLEAQKKVITSPHVVLAYKTLLAQAAHELGWPLNQVQEAVWTGAVAVMAAMHRGAGPDAKTIQMLLNRHAVQAGWSLKTVLERPDVQQHLGLLGVTPAHLRDAVAASDARLPAGHGPVRSGDNPALESLARRLPRLTPAAARPIAERFADAVTSDHTVLVHEPHNRVHTTAYAKKLAEAGRPAHAAVVSLGAPERLAFWPEELGGHTEGSWYARPLSVGGVPHIHLYVVADAPHEEGGEAHHLLHWTVPAADRQAQWRLLGALRNEGALRPAHGETRAFTDEAPGPIGARSGGERSGPQPKTLRPTKPGAPLVVPPKVPSGGTYDKVADAVTGIAGRVAGAVGQLGTEIGDMAREATDFRGLRDNVREAFDTVTGAPAQKDAARARDNQAKAARAALPPSPLPVAHPAPDRPVAVPVGADADLGLRELPRAKPVPGQPPYPRVTIGKPVVGRLPYEVVDDSPVTPLPPPAPAPTPREQLHEAILKLPGAKKFGLKPEILASMPEDQLRDFAAHLGLTQAAPTADAAAPAPAPNSASPPVPYQNRPGAHQEVINRHANWISGTHQQVLAPLGVDATAASAELRRGMQELLASGASDTKVQFVGADGRRYTATLRRKAKAFGDGADGGELFVLTFSESAPALELPAGADVEHDRHALVMDLHHSGVSGHDLIAKLARALGCTPNHARSIYQHVRAREMALAHARATPPAPEPFAVTANGAPVHFDHTTAAVRPDIAGTALAYHLNQIASERPELRDAVQRVFARKGNPAAAGSDPFRAIGNVLRRGKNPHPLAGAYDWNNLEQHLEDERHVRQFVSKHMTKPANLSGDNEHEREYQFWNRTARAAGGQSQWAHADQFWQRFAAEVPGVDRERAVAALHRVADRSLDRAYLQSMRGRASEAPAGAERNAVHREWRDTMNQSRPPAAPQQPRTFAAPSDAFSRVNLPGVPSQVAGAVGEAGRAVGRGISSLLSAKPESVRGIVHESHPGGRYDADGATAAHAEMMALRHAMSLAGALRPRPAHIPTKVHEQNLAARVGYVADRIRDQVKNKPFDPHVQDYVDAAHTIKTPDDEGDGKSVSLPAAGIGVTELAQYLHPLVARELERAGARTDHPVPGHESARPVAPARVAPVPAQLPALPPEPGAEIDLGHDGWHDDPEQRAGEILGAPSSRGGFGAQRPAPDEPHLEIADVPDPGPLPQIGNDVTGMNKYQRAAHLGNVIRPGSAPQRAVALDADQRATVQRAIAEHYDEEFAPGERTPQTAAQMVRERFGVPADQARRLVAAYQRAGAPAPAPEAPARSPELEQARTLGVVPRRSNRLSAASGTAFTEEEPEPTYHFRGETNLLHEDGEEGLYNPVVIHHVVHNPHWRNNPYSAFAHIIERGADGVVRWDRNPYHTMSGTSPEDIAEATRQNEPFNEGEIIHRPDTSGEVRSPLAGQPLSKGWLWRFGLPGGEAPQAPEAPDWRPAEAMPEDHMFAEQVPSSGRPGPRFRTGTEYTPLFGRREAGSSDEALLLGRHFQQVGDPRADLVHAHADRLDGMPGGLEHGAPIQKSRLMRLMDGTGLRVNSHGPGAVSVEWLPQPGSHHPGFQAHLDANHTHDLADKFAAVHPQVGAAIRAALEGGAAETRETSTVPTREFADTLPAFEQAPAPGGGSPPQPDQSAALAQAELRASLKRMVLTLNESLKVGDQLTAAQLLSEIATARQMLGEPVVNSPEGVLVG